MSTPARQNQTLEREFELGCIGTALESAADGVGRLVVIEGPSGIGKSQLLGEARVLAARGGAEVLVARGAELEREYPFGVVLRLLETRLARSSSVDGSGLLRGRASLAAPLFADGAGHSEGVPPTDEFALVHGLYWCVVNMSERGPLAVIIDDVQWADPLSQRFLTYLAARLDDLPVALIVAIRTGDPSVDLDLADGLAAVVRGQRLQPLELSPDAVQTMLVDAGIEAAKDAGFVDACWTATRGNPFLVREVVAALQHGSAGLDPMDVASFVPETVRRRVLVRLKRLGTSAVELARVCAVVGDDVSLWDAALLAGLDPQDAAATADRLVGAQIFVGSESLAFVHPIVRSAVYEELPPSAAMAAHAAAARFRHDKGGSPEQVAHHLLAAPPIRERWAIDALHQGARAAARKGAPATAVRLLRRALEQCEPGELTADMLVTLGLAEAAAGEAASLARFADALAIADPPDRARAIYALGETLYRYGRQADAAEALRRGAEEFGGDATVGLPFEGAFMCAAYYDASTHSEIVPRLRSIIEGGDPGPAGADSAATALAAFHHALTCPPAEPAVAAARRALADATRTPNSMATNIAMCALWLAGHAREAQQVADGVLAEASEYGNALSFAETSMMRALFGRSLGRVTDAVADAHAAIEGVARGWQGTGSAPHSVLALCLIERGALADATVALQAAERLLRPEHGVLNGWFFVARGQLRLLSGEASRAFDDLLAARDALAPYAIVNPVMAPWRSLAGMAAHACGDRERGVALIDEEIELARSFGLPVAAAAGLRAKASTLLDRDAQLATLEESLALLDDAEAPSEVARTLVALGSVQRRAGSRVASREPLRLALDLSYRCGAGGVEQEARDELLASGARPRSAAITGVESLTPSERRIAGLAAAGSSNRAIAEALFLTKNTVDWHIKNVYRKLDVDSRQGLSALLDGDGERKAHP